MNKPGLCLVTQKNSVNLNKNIPGREVEKQRTRNTKTFSLGGGAYQMAVYPEAVHYQDAEGKWREIDNRLTEKKNHRGQRVLRNGSNKLMAEFAQKTGDAPLVNLRTNSGQTLSWRVKNAVEGITPIQKMDEKAPYQDEDGKRSDFSKAESELRYVEILPHIDVVCRMQGEHFKDDIILKEPAAQKEISLLLNVIGTELVCFNDGVVVAYEDKERRKAAFVLPSPFMRDAQGNIGKVHTQLLENGKQIELVMTCDEDFLKRAVYPVVIDPLVQTSDASADMEDNFVTSLAPNTVQEPTAGFLRISKDTEHGECRSFIRFTDLPYFMPSNMVTKAYLRLQLTRQVGAVDVPVYLKEVMEYWAADTITWNNQPVLSEGDIDVEVMEAGSAIGSIAEYDVSNSVRKWYKEGNFGLALLTKENATPNLVEFGSSDNATYKPVVLINYVSFAGIQPQLAYDMFSCDRAGTVYANLYNGDVVLERPITRCSGSRMPISITAYYGYDLYGATAYMGSNWRLSCDQTVYKEEVNGEIQFVWTKGDGSQYFFKKLRSDLSVYADTAGLGLSLRDDTYTEITDKQGTMMRFESPVYVGDDSGRLLSITDACGNTATFQYTDWDLTSITDGAGRVTTISYEDGKVSAILAPGETSPVTFSYLRFSLWMISDGDDVVSEYSYESEHDMLNHVLDGQTQRELEIAYQLDNPYRVIDILEYVSLEDGSKYGKDHAYEYGNMMTTVKDYSSDEVKKLMYQFNDNGNVVCVRDELGYASYSKFSEGLLPNHPEQISKLQRSVINLLPNHNFELDGYWTTGTNDGGEGTFEYDTTQRYVGSRSLKMVKTNGAGNLCAHMNYAQLTVGKKYTFSGYIRSDGNTTGHVTAYHNSTWFNSEVITPGGEWTRVSATFTAVNETVELFFVAMGTGTLWVDAAQLEEGAVPNRYNLLQNSDFSLNSTGDPLFWQMENISPLMDGDGLENTTDETHPTFLTENRMRIYGKPLVYKTLYQELPLSGQKGDAYVAGGWASGEARPSSKTSNNVFGIWIAFRNNSGEYEGLPILEWSDEWSGWQYVAGAMIAPCDYDRIRFVVLYTYNINYADFDGMTLYKEEFGNAFTYDDDGNVTAVRNLTGQYAKATYDEFHNMLQYVQPGRGDEARTRADYGSVDEERKRRLPLSVTTPTGIRTVNNYDTHGNLTRSYTIDSMDGSMAIDSYQSYTGDGNHVASKTDSRGKIVTYETNLAKDTLTKVTDPNGQSVNYAYDSRKRVIETTANMAGKVYKNAYTYENDRIKTVAHNTTTEAPDVVYTFDYDELGNQKTVKVGTQVLSENVYAETGDRSLLRVEYGNGGKVRYTRDDFRRIKGIGYDDAESPRFNYEYGANGEVAFVHDNELQRTAWTEYDASERPSCLHIMEDATETQNGTTRYKCRIGYDVYGNVASFKEEGAHISKCETAYEYDVENRPTQLRYGADNRKVLYNYDPIGRISERTIVGETNYVTSFAYVPANTGDSIMTTPLVQSITQNGQNFSYTYDNVGNISSVTRNGLTTTYTYDLLGQLIRVNDPHANKTTVYDYDCGGNILFYREYAYTTGELGAATKTVGYTYGDSNWKDKVTAIDGKAITYDAIGNPLTYDGWTFSWKAGRLLTSMVNATINAQFTYDHNGLRVKKVVNGITTDYTLNGKLITHMTCGDNELHFFYDVQKRAAMVKYNNDDYFYVYDMQGNVVALIDKKGEQVVEYNYDAWGNQLEKTGNMAETLGRINPFRYRGYVYDEETKLYYLGTRYYSPRLKRFINTDVSYDYNAGVLRYNIYLYVANEPITSSDENGNWIIKDAIKWFVEEVVNPVVEEIDKFVSNINFTVSIGVSVSLATGFWTYSAQAGVAFDSERNVGIQVTPGASIMTIGSPQASLTGYVSITNAPSIDKLEGEGLSIGGSLNAIAAVGGELNVIPDYDENKKYYGATMSFGIGTPSGEVHIGGGETITVASTSRKKNKQNVVKGRIIKRNFILMVN